MTVLKTKLPHYFYDLQAIMPDGRQRWADDFADAAPSILQPGRDNDPAFLRARADRNKAYSMWQASFGRYEGGQWRMPFKPKNPIFQAIRITGFKHTQSSSLDWWEPYQDAVFRVFVNPETEVDPVTGEYRQWYMLCPEDCYLINRYELEKDGPSLKPRNYDGHERFFSEDPRLRRVRFVPTECAPHLRHDTTAGELPAEL